MCGEHKEGKCEDETIHIYMEYICVGVCLLVLENMGLLFKLS